MREAVVDVLLAGGVAIALLCALGLLAMRNVYDRLHFLAPASLAAVCFCAAAFVEDGPSLIALKALLVALIVLVASPALAHVTAHAARVREHGDWRLRPEEGVEVERR